MKNMISYLKNSGQILQVESWTFDYIPEANGDVEYLIVEGQCDIANAFVKGGELVKIPSSRPSMWHEWDGISEQWVDHKPVELVERELRIEQETTFNYKGNDFQVDEKSARLIGSRALKILKRKMLGETVEPFQWRLKDNTFYTFDSEEFLLFSEAVDEYLESIMKENWEKEDSILLEGS